MSDTFKFYCNNCGGWPGGVNFHDGIGSLKIECDDCGATMSLN